MSFMLVMSQHSLFDIFHEDFVTMNLPQFCIVTLTYILIIKETKYLINTHKHVAGPLSNQSSANWLLQTWPPLKVNNMSCNKNTFIVLNR